MAGTTDILLEVIAGANMFRELSPNKTMAATAKRKSEATAERMVATSGR
jgi:hypothetical protein